MLQNYLLPKEAHLKFTFEFEYLNETHPHANRLSVLGLPEKHTDITPESPAPTSLRMNLHLAGKCTINISSSSVEYSHS